MFIVPRPDVRVPEGITRSSLFSDLSKTENFNDWPVYIKQINVLSACFTFKIENELHLNDNKLKHVKSFL